MARLQFSLRQMVIATAVIGLLLAIFVQSPAGFVSVFFALTLIVGTFSWFAKVPYRV